MSGPRRSAGRRCADGGVPQPMRRRCGQRRSRARSCPVPGSRHQRELGAGHHHETAPPDPPACDATTPQSQSVSPPRGYTPAGTAATRIRHETFMSEPGRRTFRPCSQPSATKITAVQDLSQPNLTAVQRTSATPVADLTRTKRPQVKYFQLSEAGVCLKRTLHRQARCDPEHIFYLRDGKFSPLERVSHRGAASWLSIVGNQHAST